jgi:hypothetical protein
MMERIAPHVFQEPHVQFTYAALLRQRAQYQPADEIYRRFFGVGQGEPWQRSARGEVWLNAPLSISPKPVLRCKRAKTPPMLDGLLADECWQGTTEITLGNGDEPPQDEFVGTRGMPAEQRRSRDIVRSGGEPRPIVMLTYDDRFLYFAASVPRVADLPQDKPEYPGRSHDADLSGYDQLSLQIDVDRDYATCYRLDVDSRGQTRDACWIDQQWNPKWYVAADADAGKWTVEAAIPLEELAPTPFAPGTAWAVGIVRTMPTVGVQSWTHPAGAVPRPETFGLLRFE